MKPFKMFFGLSLAIMLFFFIAKFFVFAFIAAAIMSIIYAVFRRLKDFITYDRFGEYYIKRYDAYPRVNSSWNNEVEPLFDGIAPNYRTRNEMIRFVDIQ
jgi:hypothetical protein